MSAERVERAITLVSGGLDSVVSLAKALETMTVRLVLFMDYGQRARDREHSAAMATADYFGLPFRAVDVRWLEDLAPEGMRYDKTGASQPALDTLEAVWIPNRNGVFLNIAAAFAESYGCDYVVTGFNREEAEEFPDNREAYVDRVNAGLEMSTQNGVRVRSFTQSLTKSEIIQLGNELGAPLSVIWSCYHAGEHMCGRCASCKRLKDALASVSDDMRPVLDFVDDA